MRCSSALQRLVEQTLRHLTTSFWDERIQFWRGRHSQQDRSCGIEGKVKCDFSPDVVSAFSAFSHDARFYQLGKLSVFQPCVLRSRYRQICKADGNISELGTDLLFPVPVSISLAVVCEHVNSTRYLHNHTWLLFSNRDGGLQNEEALRPCVAPLEPRMISLTGAGYAICYVMHACRNWPILAGSGGGKRRKVSIWSKDEHSSSR